MRLRFGEELEARAAALRTCFEQDGFVSLPGFLAAGELAELRAQLARFLDEVLPRVPREEVYFEERDDPRSLKQVQQLGRHDPFFQELATRGTVPRLAQVLLGEQALPRNVQYFDKPAGSGRATPPHQDGAYFPIEPNHAVTLWLALEDVGEDQGCVRYARGSARRGLLEHEASGTLGFSRRAVGFDPARAEVAAFPCRAGDLVAHHSLTVHWCGPNTHEDRGRQALGFIYYGAGCHHDAAASEDYQRRLAARLAAAERI